MKYLRRLFLGLKTLSGIRKQGYFIPYRYADKVPHARPDICYGALAAEMKKSQAQFNAQIKRAAKNLPRFVAWQHETAPAHPRFKQDWFPRLDGVMAYSMVASHNPARIIEAGSGHSTRFMRQAIKDFDLRCHLTAIDPAPRASLSRDIMHKADYLQNMPLKLFKQLRAGDILFIDSSHILLSGSDVDFYLNGILPILPQGVIVHIHDIFLPYDYPKSWQWRGYNEQAGVAMLLTGKAWKILWASAYAMQNCRALLQNSGLLNLPLLSGARETSLWLEKR